MAGYPAGEAALGQPVVDVGLELLEAIKLPAELVRLFRTGRGRPQAQANLQLFAAASVAVLDLAEGGRFAPAPALQLAKQIGDVTQFLHLGCWASKPASAASRIRAEPLLTTSRTMHNCLLLVRDPRGGQSVLVVPGDAVRQ
jgi:hypothetical protein